MKNTGKKICCNVLSSGVDMANKAGKYACATAVYTGLLTFHCAKKGGGMLSKIAAAPAKKVNLKKILPGTKSAKMQSLEEKIFNLEERLALLERLGIAMPGQTGEAKALDKRKLNLLREIVEDNKLLRETL